MSFVVYLSMDIKLGQVYFYQSLQFSMTGFLKPFSRKYVSQKDGSRQSRISVANFFNLHDAINMPLYEDISEYEKFKEDGTITSLWTLEEDYLKSDNNILIPIEEMSENRSKELTQHAAFGARNRISNKLSIAIGMCESEIISYKRNKKISRIFDEIK